ncbi:YdcF family protein [Rhodoligotrophos defluvii]|uniref:YdcF family protein n=1 Tax=Rhodoligotrophos defluvii TaxID=2561934 RepID=UPI0010CA01AA|nr:YdcF family protein [Rhodoligotrophos defluvii]
MDFFAISKLFWIIADPGNFLLLLIVVGLTLQLVPRLRNKGRWLTGLGALGMVLVMLLPIGRWLIAPLENRFPVPRLGDQVDGIVVLGGVTRNDVSSYRGTPTLDEGADRLTTAVALARTYPHARIVLAGGSGDIDQRGTPEGLIMREILIELGIDPARIAVDAKSRNTYENALLAKQAAQPKPGETWVLVTSAFQMPRAVGCFRKVGFDVVPYPVDFRTPADHKRHLGDLLNVLGLAEKEWIGLLTYYLTGRTAQLFPAP